MLALLWVQTLLYAAPYGDAQRQMRLLAEGGEFITHLWALLYHLGIDKWEMEHELTRALFLEECAVDRVQCGVSKLDPFHPSPDPLHYRFKLTMLI